jgi:hypothetical protein
MKRGREVWRLRMKIVRSAEPFSHRFNRLSFLGREIK